MFDFIPPIVHEQVITRNESYYWNSSLNSIATKHLATMNPKELDEDWKLNDFFGTIAVINLPQAKDRLEKMTRELRQIGTRSFVLFRAIDGRKQLPVEIWKKLTRFGNRTGLMGHTPVEKRLIDSSFQAEAGCYMSHYTVIKRAKKAFKHAMKEMKSARAEQNPEAIRRAEQALRKSSRLLILEDDGGFGLVSEDHLSVTRKGAGFLLRKALQELPDDWDMLYFIVNVEEPALPYSKHLMKLKRSWCCVAYAINYTMYGPLVNHLKKIEDSRCTHVLPVDVEIGLMNAHFNVFAIFPSIAFHQVGKSFISSKFNSSLWQGQAKNRF